MKIETKLAQIGSTKEPVTGAISYPIYHATAFRHPKLGESTGFDYSRSGSPTREVLEQAIAELESGDAGFACSSGMAALQIVLCLFSQGDHLLVSIDLYGGTYRLLDQVMSRFGITASYVDTSCIESLNKAKQKNTKGIIVETPTNPLMLITDLQQVSAWCKQHGIISIVDNTLLTPYFQRPIEHGIDIVVHSATKYLGGHNDVLAGLIVTKGAELSEKVAFLHNSIGAVLGPQDSWLLMRGMKTLALRMDRHEQSALQISEYLSTHPMVEEVLYPGLTTHSCHELQKKQSSGNAGIFSFRMKDPRAIEPLLRHIKLIAFAESLGGVESLMTYPAIQTHADVPEDVRKEIGVDEHLLRFSVGIEHVDDLLDDLKQALRLTQEELEGETAHV